MELPQSANSSQARFLQISAFFTEYSLVVYIKYLYIAAWFLLSSMISNCIPYIAVLLPFLWVIWLTVKVAVIQRRICRLIGSVHHRQGRCSAWAATQPQARIHGIWSATQPYIALICRFNGVHPCNLCKYIRGLLLAYRLRWDGRLSWPSWLTRNGQFTHKVIICQP